MNIFKINLSQSHKLILKLIIKQTLLYVYYVFNIIINLRYSHFPWR